MASAATATKRPRKENWNTKDVHHLLDLIETNYNDIVGAFSASLTQASKTRIWSDITESFPGRSVTDVKRKFFQLKSDKIRAYNAHLKIVKGTGGGPPPHPVSPLTQRIVKIVGIENPKISGIPGGIDSGIDCSSAPVTLCSATSNRSEPTEPESSAEEDYATPVAASSQKLTSPTEATQSAQSRAPAPATSSATANQKRKTISLSGPARSRAKTTAADQRPQIGSQIEAEAVAQNREQHQLVCRKLQLEIELIKLKKQNEQRRRAWLDFKLSQSNAPTFLEDEEDSENEILHHELQDISNKPHLW